MRRICKAFLPVLTGIFLVKTLKLELTSLMGIPHKNPSYLMICLLWLKAITALKKGAQLLKYGRRGKPKFCPFKLSNVSNYCMSYHVTYLHGFS
jgi:hypothetical protein